jgi:predicted RNase H-like HicB family nuclease
MKVMYPVVISKGDKYYLASVPDCEIDTQGADVQEAVEMARDAISLWCVTQEDAKHSLPKASDMAVVEREPGDIVTLVDADVGEYRRLLDNRAVRKNVTIPARLGAFAEQYHIGLSRLLQDSLEKLYNEKMQKGLA